MSKLIGLITFLLGVNLMAVQLPDINSIWDFSNTSKTRQKFEELVTKYTAHKEFTLELKTQIARTLALESKFEQAHKLLDHIKLSLTDDFKVASARYFLERGRVYNSSNKKQKAVKKFLKAFEVSKLIGHEYLIVDSAHMLAIAEAEFADQKKWTEIAINEASLAKDPKVKDWKGSLLNNWGWSLFDQKEYHQALTVFRDALAFRETKNNVGATIIAKWCIARTLRALNEIEQALDIQLALLKEWEKVGKQDGYVYEELGEIYLVKKQKDLRMKYFKKAYDELSQDKWLADNEPERLARIKSLSN